MIADGQLPISDWRLAIKAIGKRKSKIRRPTRVVVLISFINHSQSHPLATSVALYALGPRGEPPQPAVILIDHIQ
jgi:hypothetical protein